MSHSKKLIKPTLLIGFFTLLSRILGFIRDILFAKFFGASGTMEAFLVAFRIPNFIRRLFTEGSIAQALIPELNKRSVSQKRLNAFIAQLIGILGLALFLLTIIGIIFSTILVLIFAPGFVESPEKFNLANNLLKIMLPFVFFMSITSIFASLLQTFQRFSIPAITPSILNIAIITGLYISYLFHTPIYAVAWSVTLAGMLQCLIQIPFVLRLGISLKPIFRRPSKKTKRFFKSIGPAIFGASIVQISLLLDTIFASFLVTGSLSWLYYPDRVNQFPLGIFGIALATVLLPHLSKKMSVSEYNNILNWGIKLALLLTIPAASALCVLSKPIIITLFYHGEFSFFDVMQSQRAMIAFAIGLISFIFIKIFISALYAKQNTTSAMKVGLLCILVNIISNLILISLLKSHALGYLALAISTSLTATINALFLLWVLCKKHHFSLHRSQILLIIRILIASIIMCIVLIFTQGELNFWLSHSTLFKLLYLFAIIFIGACIYFLSLIILGAKVKDFSIAHS